MKKKIILSIFCCLSVLLIATGCSKEFNDNEITNYLQDKYNKNFTFVGEGDDVWSSNTITKIYSDNNKNEFKIKINDDYLSDNYYSVIYDEEISKYYQNEFTSSYKVFVSSESYYTNNSKSYTNVNEYIDDIVGLNVSIYTTDNNIETTKNKLDKIIFNGNYVSGVIYVVSNDDFVNITDYNNNSIDILNSEPFSFTNGILDKE